MIFPCVLLFLVGCGLVLVDPAALPPPADTPAEIVEFAQLANEHRVRQGCRALAWDERVAAVAQAHSDDMRRRRYYAHRDPEGRDHVARLRAAGIVTRADAENIARTEFGAEQVLYLWLQSRGHRRSLEGCRFTHHGIGLSGDYWTHVLVAYR
jgi:uncharacterized protein YkwD